MHDGRAGVFDIVHARGFRDPAGLRRADVELEPESRGAALVERVDGDYLNVVGLPASLLIRLLAEKFPGTYGFG